MYTHSTETRISLLEAGGTPLLATHWYTSSSYRLTFQITSVSPRPIDSGDNNNDHSNNNYCYYTIQRNFEPHVNADNSVLLHACNIARAAKNARKHFSARIFATDPAMKVYIRRS